MSEIKFKAWEEIFAVVKGKIEKHICKWNFEIEGEMKYVITPYGKLAILTWTTIFDTFEGAKAYLTQAAQDLVVIAQEQFKEASLFMEADVEVLPDVTPSEEELQADDNERALETAEADSEPKSESEEPVDPDLKEEKVELSDPEVKEEN